MSLAEVKNLRSQNRYEDAFRMSKADLEAHPTDIWMKRSHAWSLYYLIKKHVQAGESQQAKHYFSQFESLEMPENEVLLHEKMNYFRQVLSSNYLSAKQLIQEGKFEEAFDLHASEENPKPEQLAWALYYLLRNLNKSKTQDPTPILPRLKLFASKVTPQKLLVYKLLVQELIKLPLDFWKDTPLTFYLEYLGLFDLLEEEDFQKFEQEGKKIISLAERLHIAYSKALIREKSPSQKVEKYLKETVEPLLEPRKDMLYVFYFKAKLLLEIGNREQGMKAFLPFARRKRGEFWIWQVFAEFHEDNPSLYLSCLCKAMTCRVKPEFLSGIKERLIAHLIATRQFDWAKTELMQLLVLREKQQWGLRTHHRQLLASDWYAKSKEIPIEQVYQMHLGPAEALLGVSATPPSRKELLIVIDYVNTEKKIFNFVGKGKTKGFGQYTHTPELGGIYRMIAKDKGDGFFKVERLSPANDAARELPELRKEVKGRFKQKHGQHFGFVDGVYVPSAMIKELQLTNNQHLIGLAIYGPVKGKEQWAWRLIKAHPTG